VKLRCALCGRPVTNPTVLIGQLPVGSTCARRAGLVELARKRVGSLSIPRITFKRPEPQENLELFEKESS
jgi:hypothetical protein